jgi:hypothetical protein
MRVRPFFWFLFTFTCVGVLTFAFFFQRDVPALIHLSLDHPSPKVQQMVTLSLHLTDTEGVPIEHASIISRTNMTTMDMREAIRQLIPVGHGNYITHLQFSMSGEWFVIVNIHAGGILPVEQHLFLRAT